MQSRDQSGWSCDRQLLIWLCYSTCGTSKTSDSCVSTEQIFTIPISKKIIFRLPKSPNLVTSRHKIAARRMLRGVLVFWSFSLFNNKDNERVYHHWSVVDEVIVVSWKAKDITSLLSTHHRTLQEISEVAPLLDGVDSEWLIFWSHTHTVHNVVHIE